MLRFLDAGESHGLGIVTIIEGLPAGLMLGKGDIEHELSRRRLGYGRGSRMQLEKDEAEILSGVRLGLSLGSPIAVLVRNAESEKWRERMRPEGTRDVPDATSPRPGHADLAGAVKYGTRDLRDIIERSSARATVGRVITGACAKSFLIKLGISIFSHVLSIGSVRVKEREKPPGLDELAFGDNDPVRCLDSDASLKMIEAIDRSRASGDSVGGTFEIIAFGLPIGLGSHVQWDRRLDGNLAASVMSIQAIKGVEIGDGFKLAELRGSKAADVIHHKGDKGFYRLSNHAGGLEGGITNGEPLIIRAAMKPIPTISSPPDTIDILSKQKVPATVERADTCAVPAAAVVSESAVAFELAKAILEKLGGDSMVEIKSRFEVMVSEQIAF